MESIYIRLCLHFPIFGLQIHTHTHTDIDCAKGHLCLPAADVYRDGEERNAVLLRYLTLFIVASPCVPPFGRRSGSAPWRVGALVRSTCGLIWTKETCDMVHRLLIKGC